MMDHQRPVTRKNSLRMEDLMNHFDQNPWPQLVEHYVIAGLARPYILGVIERSGGIFGQKLKERD